MSESNWNKKEGSFPETTKIFTPNLPESVDRIIIHKDLSLPIIRAVQSQNIALKSQLQKVEEEVVNLEGMTKHLEQENQNLRSHYFQRNRDVQNIIQSIKINLGVQTSDINHHTHLLREGNCLLFKNIQGQLKKERQYNQRIQQLTKKLAQLKQSNVKLQQNVLFPLRVRLGNKLNKKKLQQLTQERDKKTKTEEELAKQINRLLMDVNSLQKENLKGLRQEREEKSNISKQKQSFKGNIINALKSLQELKSDIELQTNTLKQHTQYRDELMSKSKKVQQQAIRRNIEMEKKMSQLNKVLSKRQNQMKFYDQTRKATSQLELQLMKKREQKQKLKTALIAKQMDIEKQQAQHQGIKQKVREETNISIFKLRVRIQTAEIEAKKEEKQLQRLYELEQENIESLKEELMELKKDLQYYQSVLRRVENPAKQLQREQVKQRLNQTRRPLFEKQR